jgi:nicotinate-nucleotide adenylyltransferase
MIGILGGTFDPVHTGHLCIALELYQTLPLKEIRFIPCGQPPHRDPPRATADQRLAMLRMAIEDQQGFCIDERELRRRGPSYMVDTLSSLRNEFPDVPLCLIIGLDVFKEFDKWHRWSEIPKLAHMVVVHRPAADLADNDRIFELLEQRRVTEPKALLERLAGAILPWPVRQLDISSTDIRSLIADHKSPRYLLPEQVYSYIQNEGLYRS